MRFIAILNINKFEVGKGYGANKRIAKMTAARMALQVMVPNVFQEWVTSCGRLNALNR
jgi:dsRNA-specific ribonuclease